VTVEEKALELVAENRVVLLRKPVHEGIDEAIVAGHHDHYTVYATVSGCECSCPARTEKCAHKLAAMVVWAERETHEQAKPW
jgi:hypothetical protein